jgi:hypothetical protein
VKNETNRAELLEVIRIESGGLMSRFTRQGGNNIYQSELSGSELMSIMGIEKCQIDFIEDEVVQRTKVKNNFDKLYQKKYLKYSLLATFLLIFGGLMFSGIMERFFRWIKTGA